MVAIDRSVPLGRVTRGSALPTTAPYINLVPAIRASLEAQLERLLDRPVIATVGAAEEADGDADAPDAFRALRRAARRAHARTVWREDPEDGTCWLRVNIDYDETWRGSEREVKDTVANTVEGSVTLLTDHQRDLLESSPREFLALYPPPETVELVGFNTENVGGSVQVVELQLAETPESSAHVRHIAIVQNLVQVERQLEALRVLEDASDEGPLAPLRALVGLADATVMQRAASEGRIAEQYVDGRLDEHQRACVEKAIATPHFAVINGPPGSGKTTVIATVIRQALGRGERVLVASSTHVAVDNVVDRLVPAEDSDDDDFRESSMPVRYAARPNKLTGTAAPRYWVGAMKQRRGAAIARRVRARLLASDRVASVAELLFRLEDPDVPGHAPLSSAFARNESVICGTPIGILSYGPVKHAGPGDYDLLIVDEVSKMTLPVFLAIAVKARRWVVVGDPAQLPPINKAEENGTSLDDVLSPTLELACSVGAVLERAKPHARAEQRLVVVASNPDLASEAIRGHAQEVFRDHVPSVGVIGDAPLPGILVCAKDQVVQATELLCHDGRRGRPVRILDERDIDFEYLEATEFVEQRHRASAAIFENAFNVYHAQPWANRAKVRLPLLSFRNGLEKYLPSASAVAALKEHGDGPAQDARSTLVQEIATRFAVNTVSVYDWLTGMPVTDYDCSPLVDLGNLTSLDVCTAVSPFVGTLKKQYRMHSSLSWVPRDLFYFGEALDDGVPSVGGGNRVELVQVDPGPDDCGESNEAEVEAVAEILGQLYSTQDAEAEAPTIMVITPYREQEAALRSALEERHLGDLSALGIEVCTLDRCQGREADYVLISLVRSKAGPFYDLPKRWNVALTRAKQGLFIVGSIDAYLHEAASARRDICNPAWQRGHRAGPAEDRPRMSLLARVLEAYDQQARKAPQARLARK